MSSSEDVDQSTGKRDTSSGWSSGLKGAVQVIKDAAKVYLPNAIWSLLDLVDKDPSGFWALLDRNKVAGALLLRHFLPLMISHPWMILPTIFVLILIGVSSVQRRVSTSSGRSIAADVIHIAESTSREIVEGETREINERIDALEETVQALAQTREEECNSPK